MSDLIQRLSTGKHALVASRYATAEEFREALDRGYVILKFTETQGGTEIGVKLDEARTSSQASDFGAENGAVNLRGTLTFNYAKVELVAQIDISSRSGHGFLVPQESTSADADERAGSRVEPLH